jgi:gliding motility-associated-like protein
MIRFIRPDFFINKKFVYFVIQVKTLPTLMKQKFPLLIAFLALAFPASVSAQIFYSNGATVTVTPGGVLWCNGGITLDNTSSMTNNGSVTTTKSSSFALPGTFTINGSSSSQGNGTYQVEQDWINNATFVANNSTVRLYGNTQQFITSVNGTVTTFHHLTLLGNGVGNNRKKSLLLVNAISDGTGIDSINNRELETQTNIFFVQNTSTAAMYNDQTAGSEGFVSSTNPGTLSRLTTGSANYLFPVGSSNVLTRYRPVNISPVVGSTSDEFHVRFVNYNPDVDGFLRSQNDGTICLANDTFYHAIDRPTGTDFADVTINYIPANDGNWVGMSHWRNTSTNWNDMGTVGFATAGVFTQMNRLGWQFANPGFPYVLTDVRPQSPTITCPTVCENSPNNLFTANGGTGYLWTVPANGTIANGQGTDSLYVNWNTGTAPVSVVSVSPTGCQSLPAICSPVVSAAPVASFLDTASGTWSSEYTFIDMTGTATTWAWDFGDGNGSVQQNPSHTYTGAGTYTVTLIVTNAAGCMDTITSIVTALEGILIPNVFTPNGDGTNDEFYIPNSGLKEYNIEIFDRWGVKIFESTAPDIRWDGRSTSGNMCTDGTYYYILKAITTTRDYSTTGFVTLIGNKQ